jgi:hypothetical protein
MSVRTFVVEREVEVMVDLTQIDLRFARNKTSYAVTRLILMGGQQDRPVLVDGVYGMRKTIAVRARLQPGQYFIYLDSSWPAKKGDLILTLFHADPQPLPLHAFDSQRIPQLLSGLYQTPSCENKLVIHRYVSARTGLIIEKIGNGMAVPTRVQRALGAIRERGLEVLFSENWDID